MPMTYTEKLLAIADKLEQKWLKQGQALAVSQLGTTELFFGNVANQQSFNTAIQSGAIAKFLTDLAVKTQKTAGFELQAKADPQVGAGWILQATPPSQKNAVYKLLDAELRKIVGKGTEEVQKSADASAKAGSGSGTINVGSFFAEMD
jgi:hypothetical protein